MKMFGESLSIKTLITWGIMIAGGGAAWATLQHTVSEHTDKIASIEVNQNSQEKILDRMDYNVQIIARQVGVKPLKKADDE
jgi:hypothetical protein